MKAQERVVVCVMSPEGILVQGAPESRTLALPTWPLPEGVHPVEAALEGLMELTGEDAFQTFRKLPVPVEGLHLFQTHPERDLPAHFGDGATPWRFASAEECLPKLEDRAAALALEALLS